MAMTTLLMIVAAGGVLTMIVPRLADVLVKPRQAGRNDGADDNYGADCDAGDDGDD